MGLDNPIHIAFLLILLLLVFGAKRLPEMGKSLGSGMRGFKDALSGEEHRASLTPATEVPAPVATPLATPVATRETETTPQQVAV
jgi:sec-independent protein translocase protein TatA